MPISGEAVSYWPFLVLAASMVFVAAAIVVFRIHAFFALMLAAMLAGALSETLPGSPARSHFVDAIELPMLEFGATASKIAWVIALASLIGACLMESGAADKIVRSLLRTLVERRAAWALLICGFVLGVPVFFDTVFLLLIPLAQALSLRLGKNYLLYVVAIASGAIITHTIVPPTPGPLFMAETLPGVDLGLCILAGLAAGVLPAIAAIALGKRLNARSPIELRTASGAALAELKAIVDKPERDLPPLLLALLPVVLPVCLIALASIGAALGGRHAFGASHAVVEVLGNKNLAMLLGAVIALGVLAKQQQLGRDGWAEIMVQPLAIAGVIILITSAGGAFGAMIQRAGVGASLDALTSGRSIDLIWVAWAAAAVMKTAQGSSTVAIITTSAILASLIGDGSSLPYHPLWIYLAIGFGSMMISWMNDSGFWVVCKLSGFSERETLRTWTLSLAVISLVGLAEVAILSRLLPLITP
jgi:GntP family gluconate:H+ symporter